MFYRFLNFFIRWTGYQFMEDHVGFWSVKDGKLQCKRIPCRTYSLRPVTARTDETQTERFIRENMKKNVQSRSHVSKSRA